MEKRAKMGIGPMVIIGIIYTILGGVFVTLGLVFLNVGADDIRLVGAIFAGIGAVFLILGILFLILQIWKRKEADRLIASGCYVWGEVVDCVPNFNVRINNRHPYILMVRLVDTQGVNHIFKSPSLWIFRNPGLIGRRVKVYYQDDSFRRYYVDTEGIAPNFIEH